MLKRLVLSPPERQRLRERVRSRSARAEEVQRAKIILLNASGQSQWAVSRRLGCSINTVRLRLKRFMDERLAGLFSRHRGKIAGQQSAKLEARILATARQKPTDGSTHWNTRKLAAELGTNHTRVARVLAKAGLQPILFAITISLRILSCDSSVTSFRLDLRPAPICAAVLFPSRSSSHAVSSYKVVAYYVQGCGTGSVPKAMARAIEGDLSIAISPLREGNPILS